MKILIAGATGAIGHPLIDILVRSGHVVFGVTQSKDKARILSDKGAHPVVLDVLDKDGVFLKMSEIRPEVVVDMLTRLPKEYTPDEMRKASEMDAKIRIEGGGHLLSAAERYGTKRFICQSSGFWYEPGEGLADEHVSFAFEASPGIAAGARIYKDIEDRLLDSPSLESVALRFGFFYGPGTWFCPEGDVARQLHQQMFPLIGEGHGVWNFIHIFDAAEAIVSAIDCQPGIYNIVNDHPSKMREWLPAFAHFVNAPPPPVISEEEGFQERGADAVYYAMRLRGASNKKAKERLKFMPRSFEWFE